MNRFWVVLVALLAVVSIGQEAEDGQYLQMKRTACVILSRVHSNAHKEVIEEVMQSLEAMDQQKYINKLYSSSVQICEGEISQQEVQSVHLKILSFMSKTQTSHQTVSSISSNPSITEM
jgi:hypothetical protein